MNTVDKLEKVYIKTEFIKLDQLLKWLGLVESGTDAKFYIEEGKVSVNDEIQYQRGKKIFAGDKVSFENRDFLIDIEK